MKATYLVMSLVAILLLAINEPEFGQCAMCKGAAETSMQEGSQDASGLNFGVLYLFATPYLLVLTIGGLMYWNYRKNKQEALENK